MAEKEGFVFNTPWEEIVGHAKNLTEFKKLLKTLPAESLRFHAERGDFAAWLKYLGKKEYAQKIARVKSGEREKLLSVFAPKKKTTKKAPAKKKTTTKKKPKTAKKTSKKKTTKKSKK